MAKLVARDSHLIDDGYLFLFLNSKQTTIKSSCRGTTVPHVSPEALVSLKLPLPPLIEQERIVDLVSSVDSYIFALQQQADAARAARSAVLSELLSAGGDDWIETTLGETLEIARGGSPRPIRDFITSEESGVNWVKIGDASASSKYIYRTEQKIRQDGVSRSRPVKVGDFILSNSMSFGRPYIMRTDGCIHDGWLLFSKVEDHFDEDFLYNLLMSDSVQTQFDSLAAGSGVRNLNIEVVGEVRISLPPLDLQREIAEVANSLDAYVLAIEQSIVDSTRLRVGLLTDLLSGEHEIPESYDRLLGAA
jgi:type I restriction enzyme S subunit